MKGYKLVTVLKDGTMVSLVPSSYRLTYGFGTPTVPKIGKLFVFQTRQAARDLKRYLDSIEKRQRFVILQGTVTPENVDMTRHRVVCMDIRSYQRNLNSKCIPWFWRNSSKECSRDMGTVEMGTMFCDDFTPMKLVR